jgi:uncharacterized protein
MTTALAAVPTAGPVYALLCTAPDGTAVRLRYSPHDSALVDESGASLLADAEPGEFAEAPVVAPDTPGRKVRQVHTLKIQLGLRCNYACSYCSQASSVPEAVVTRSADADRFIAELDGWLQGSPARVEFWGGEPLLYFGKLRRLVPALRSRFPQAVLAMVTNGSLLDAEILDFIEANDILVAVSHDGPGQHLRGPDPFDDPVLAGRLRELWRRRGPGRHRVTFNVVLTPANADLAATRAWFADRLGDPDVALDVEGIVGVYDERTLGGAGAWTEQQYARMHRGIVDAFQTGASMQFWSLREKARDFVHSLQSHRPAAALGQKCGMDAQDQLAVDLHGHVMTCQNTGAVGRHRIGHVQSLEQARLVTATHWSRRDSCGHCPVLQLCRGSCMYLEGEHFAQSCDNEYRYNLAILAGVLKVATGLDLQAIEGDIRRPPRRRSIPIRPQGVACT